MTDAIREMAQYFLERMENCKHEDETLTITINPNNGERNIKCDFCGHSVTWGYHTLQDAVQHGGKDMDFIKEMAAIAFGTHNRDKVMRMLLEDK